MTIDLIRRIRKQRELKVTVGKFVFIARRPTDVEAVELHRSSVTFADIAEKFVSGWENITEDDVLGGGGSDSVEFDADLWREWCHDRPDFWEPIASAVLESYRLHASRLETEAKN